MKQRQRMPSQKAIYAYWRDGDGLAVFSKHGIELGDPSSCFACGFDLKVERAHIIATSDGGTNTPDNIHLLCPNCHLESETLNEKFYWVWLKNKNIRKFRLPLEYSQDRLSLLDRDFTEWMSLIKECKFRKAAEWLLETTVFCDKEEHIVETAAELKSSFEGKDLQEKG